METGRGSRPTGPISVRVQHVPAYTKRQRSTSGPRPQRLGLALHTCRSACRPALSAGRGRPADLGGVFCSEIVSFAQFPSRRSASTRHGSRTAQQARRSATRRQPRSPGRDGALPCSIGAGLSAKLSGASLDHVPHRRRKKADSDDGKPASQCPHRRLQGCSDGYQDEQPEKCYRWEAHGQREPDRRRRTGVAADSFGSAGTG